MKFSQFRKPIRIHTQGYGGDILLTDFAGSCGDLQGPDAIGVHFENDRAGFVLSYADLKQAVRAIEIERRYAREQRIRDGAPALAGDAPKEGG